MKIQVIWPLRSLRKTRAALRRLSGPLITGVWGGQLLDYRKQGSRQVELILTAFPMGVASEEIEPVLAQALGG